MSLTAYEIALISGGFAILGVLLGVLITYYFSIRLMKRQEFNQAAKEFRIAFSEELTKLRLDCPRTSIYDIIFHARNKHGQAYDIFSGYFGECDLKRFHQAWSAYYVLTPTDPNKEQDKDEDIIFLVDKIKELLDFAKFK